MDHDDFAQRWIEDWNSHDLDRILSHYAEDARFQSPFAKILTGEGAVHGRDGLRAYWAEGLLRRPALRFQLLGAFGGHASAAVQYRDESNRTAVETMMFDEKGKITISTACYDRLQG